MRQLRFPYWLLLLPLLAMCKKDVDENPPVITWAGPAANQNYTALTPLLFAATVTDDRVIESIQLDIRNQDFVRVLPAVTLRPNEADFSFEQGLLLDDIHLNSGQYFAVITAFDETNSAREFREIFINGIPRTREAIVTLSETIGGEVDIWKVDTDDNVSLYHSFIATSFKSSIVNSYHQQIAVAGPGLDRVQVIDANSNLQSWQVQSGPSMAGFDYFNSLHFSLDDLNTYISVTGGPWIRAYNKAGQLRHQFETGHNRHAESMIRHEGLLVAEIRTAGTGNHSLASYFPSSGALQREVSLPVDAIALFGNGDDEIFVFGNEAGQAEMHIYYPSGNSFWEPHSIAAGVLNDVAEISEGNYLLAHQTGLYIYSSSNNNLLPLVSNISPSQVVWDDVNNEVWVAVGSTLNVYTAAGSFLRSVNTSATILDLHVLYNK